MALDDEKLVCLTSNSTCENYRPLMCLDTLSCVAKRFKICDCGIVLIMAVAIAALSHQAALLDLDIEGGTKGAPRMTPPAPEPPCWG